MTLTEVEQYLRGIQVTRELSDCQMEALNIALEIIQKEQKETKKVAPWKSRTCAKREFCSDDCLKCNNAVKWN